MHSKLFGSGGIRLKESAAQRGYLTRLPLGLHGQDERGPGEAAGGPVEEALGQDGDR
jgi:hypothetical protein